MADEFITIARVVKPQGRHGEVAAEILTDFPERFAERKRVFALDERGGRRELRIEGFWPHKERIVLKFAGVHTISEAQTLTGCPIQIPRQERTVLEAGAEYVGDLVGCTIIAAGRQIGTVADVQFGAGEAPLLVVRQAARELLIPLAAEFLQKMDTSAKRIEMRLPEGLLELDAPLNREEKEAQQKPGS